MNLITLITKDGATVTTLSMEKNLAVYLMFDRGSEPNIIIWGSRIFVKSKTQSKYYIEEFYMVVF